VLCVDDYHVCTFHITKLDFRTSRGNAGNIDRLGKILDCHSLSQSHLQTLSFKIP